MSFNEGPPSAVPLTPDLLADPGERADPVPSSDRAEPRDAAGPAGGSQADLLATLENLARVPLAEHAEHYQQIHAHLQARLAEIDSA